MHSDVEAAGHEPVELSFEKAFRRIDELLKKLNSPETSLEEALLCYEEADKLIVHCGQKLNAAERRLEMIVKNRQGDVAFDEHGHPRTTPFTPM